MKCYGVAVYLQDRAYGGAEEGGWWYDTGTLSDDPAHIVLTRFFKSEAAARRYADKLNDKHSAAWNEGRNSDVGSVLSEGKFWAEVTEGRPESYPSTQPMYC